MKRISKKETLPFLKGKILWVCISVGVLYWLFDSTVDNFIFSKSVFFSELFFTDVPHFFMRLGILIIFAITGVYIQLLYNRQRLAIKSIIESEQRYRDLFENANDLIQSLTPEGRFEYVNKKWLETLGYTREEVENLTLMDVLREDQIPHCMAMFERIRSGEALNRVETVFITKDGKEIFLEGNANAIFKNGIFIATRGIYRDITDQKKTEQFSKNILESLTHSLVVINPEYRIISANSISGKYAKMPVENFIGEHCYKVSHNANQPCFELGEDCAVKHTFETGEAYNTIHTHIDKNSKESFIELHSYPMKDSSGRIVAVIETAIDITPKKELEEQLRQAQKLESIGTLTGGIAHDFNNILTAIISYASVVQMKMAENDPLRQHVQKIIISAEKAANLTRGLLTFSRQHISNLKIIDLNEIINGLVDNFSGAGIEIRRILSKEKLDIMADKGQIEQVLISLYSNARDAMPDKGTLFIETSIMEMDEKFIKVHGYGKTGKYAVIAVTDTGIGMDNNTLEKIFDPFFTTKEVGKGTGIGLAVAYGIVQQHHGHIKCYSEPGKGTTFRIYLPMPIEKDKAYSSVSMMGGTETILLAEDDEKIRKNTKTILESFGYNVIEASDGEEAIEKFEENKKNINLLILDVIMPKKKGNEVFEEIQKTNPDVNALFISGYSSEALYEKGIDQDKLNFIAKPVSPRDILQKIRMVLKH